MNVLIWLLSCPLIITAMLRRNSPGKPLASFPQCENDMSNAAASRGVGAIDFNPVLRSYGHMGYPGFKIRINRNAFRYGTSVIAQMLNQEMRNVRIPSFTQCLPEVNGCAYLTNILITNYQCARHIALFPISYKEVVLNIQNFDLNLSGQLGGQVVVLLPLPLCGTLCVDARQISISLQIAIERNPYSGTAYIHMTKCSLTIGYLNIYIVNGGLIGEVINNNFRSKIISQAYATLPQKFCDMVPPMLDEHVNSRLARVPQGIPITQMISYASSLISKPRKLPQYCYSEVCKRYHSTNLSLANKKLSTKAILTAGVPNMARPEQKIIGTNKSLAKSEYLANNTLLEIVGLQETNDQKLFAPAGITKKFPQKVQKIRQSENWRRTKRNACASNLLLSTYLLSSSATNSDLTLNLLGEFSPNAQGGTPFAPPVLQYPVADSGQMFDLLISDYTFNTLLYHLHRKGVFTFRIGPEIPVIGDLLNLTCMAEDVDFELSLEMQDNKEVANNTTFNETNSQHNRRKRRTAMDTLLNFGICLGDIAPDIREKYPGKRVYIVIKTSRAPSVQFQAAKGGTSMIEFILDGLIFLDGTTTRVGHMQVTIVFSITTQLVSNRIIGKAQIQRMNFVDVDKTFGLPEEAFTNLSDLTRGIISRAINKKLAYGIPMIMPQLGFPIQLHNIHLQVIEHALLMSTDASIPSLAYRFPYRRYAGCSYYS
uniref:BPI2 domain-containing protein n=1 Tax=Elaeophora elaphi TaxID=1147741 RepID=A0A0R3RRC3_9BILA